MRIIESNTICTLPQLFKDGVERVVVRRDPWGLYVASKEDFEKRGRLDCSITELGQVTQCLRTRQRERMLDIFAELLNAKPRIAAKRSHPWFHLSGQTIGFLHNGEAIPVLRARRSVYDRVNWCWMNDSSFWRGTVDLLLARLNCMSEQKQIEIAGILTTY